MDGSIVSRLVTRLQHLAAQREEVGLVGHSFGGLLLREALAAVPELRVKPLVTAAARLNRVSATCASAVHANTPVVPPSYLRSTSVLRPLALRR